LKDPEKFKAGLKFVDLRSKLNAMSLYKEVSEFHNAKMLENYVDNGLIPVEIAFLRRSLYA